MLYCVTHILKSTDHNSIKFMEQSTCDVSRVSSSDSESSIQVLFLGPCIKLASSAPSSPTSLPNPYLFIVRVNGSIVLLVKYNFSMINVTTQGSTKWSLTEGTLCTMLVIQLYSENAVCL